MEHLKGTRIHGGEAIKQFLCEMRYDPPIGKNAVTILTINNSARNSASAMSRNAALPVSPISVPRPQNTRGTVMVLRAYS